MFEINDEETLEQPTVEEQEDVEESVVEEQQQVTEETVSFDEGDTIAIEKVESDEESEQEETVEEPIASEDELFLGLASAAEEGDTKIFEKIESDNDSSKIDTTVEANTEENKENMANKKVRKQPRKVRRKKQEKLGFNWFFWISLIVIAIPVAYFISLLVEASKESRIPILGDRIKNTVVYVINESDVVYVSETVKQLEGVESADINLIVGTLRINVDVNNEYTEEQIKDLILSIYTIVDERIPIATYFTRDGDYKQYDLEIMAYNDINSEEIIIINLIKNGSMEEYAIQVLSSAVNPELVDRLKEEQNPNKEEEPEDGDDSDDGIEYDEEGN